MQEEIIALIPVLLVLSRGLGFGAITALAMSVGAAAVGSAFGPTNPFQTGIALRFAEMPPLSQPALRVGLLVAAVAVWIGWTVAMTARDRVPPGTAPVTAGPATTRDAVLLAVVLLPSSPMSSACCGTTGASTSCRRSSSSRGFAVGLFAGRSLSDTAARFLKGMEGMLAASALRWRRARDQRRPVDGQVLDTILHALATPWAVSRAWRGDLDGPDACAAPRAGAVGRASEPC